MEPAALEAASSPYGSRVLASQLGPELSYNSRSILRNRVLGDRALRNRVLGNRVLGDRTLGIRGLRGRTLRIRGLGCWGMSHIQNGKEIAVFLEPLVVAGP